MLRQIPIYNRANIITFMNYKYECRLIQHGCIGALSDNMSNFHNIGNRINSTEETAQKTYTSNQLNQYTSLTNPVETPTYDDDGNMLTNGAWAYVWDMENRLVAAENDTVRLEFSYDRMSRRIEKKIYQNNILATHLKFIYNEFKLIEERDCLNENSVRRRYTWSPVGLDAPLYVDDVQSNVRYYYHTDANKNVTELTDATGAVVAHYEYSPFGKVLVANGAYATTNPFRFSSEYSDTETGLVYYNYRYYSPELGRWLNPDPIGEQGGWNLYAMVKNNVNNFIDKDGLADIRIPMNGLTPPSGEPSPEFKNSLYKIVSAMKNKKCPESFDCQTVCSELYNSFSSSAFVNCVASCERGLGFPPVPVKKGIWEKVKDFFVNLFN